MILLGNLQHDESENGPCTSTLDLGFKKSLDSTLPKVRSFDLDEFKEQILEAWDSYPEDKLGDLFNMKQRVLREIIKDGGGNSFKLPHRSAADKHAR